MNVFINSQIFLRYAGPISLRDDDSKICADLHVTLLNCSYSETNADVLKCANLKKLKEPIVSLVTNLNNKNNVCKKLSPV